MLTSIHPCGVQIVIIYFQKESGQFIETDAPFIDGAVFIKSTGVFRLDTCGPTERGFFDKLCKKFGYFRIEPSPNIIHTVDITILDDNWLNDLEKQTNEHK